MSDYQTPQKDGEVDILFKKPGAEAMSRNTKGDVMPQTEALAYASALPPRKGQTSAVATA